MVFANQKKTVYILIPVYNRKQLTLECLRILNQQGSFQHYRVIVIDDGSTDGTSEVIHSNYPEVTILSGDGELWWTGAICKGMNYAVNEGADFIVWLNDDCLPQAGSIEKLVEVVSKNSKVIAGAQSIDPETLNPTYGGVIVEDNQIKPIYALENILVKCDGLNGNLVCFSKEVLHLVGYPDSKRFPQYHGDTTYTLEAKKQGFELIIHGGAVAHCCNNNVYMSSATYWLENDFSLFRFWKGLTTKKSSNYWSAELGFYQDFLGFLGTYFYVRDRIFRFLIFTIIKILVPFKLQRKISAYLYLMKSKFKL